MLSFGNWNGNYSESIKAMMHLDILKFNADRCHSSLFYLVFYSLLNNFYIILIVASSLCSELRIIMVKIRPLLFLTKINLLGISWKYLYAFIKARRYDTKQREVRFEYEIELKIKNNHLRYYKAILQILRNIIFVSLFAVLFHAKLPPLSSWAFFLDSSILSRAKKSKEKR